jgi:hypothetical protein
MEAAHSRNLLALFSPVTNEDIHRGSGGAAEHGCSVPADNPALLPADNPALLQLSCHLDRLHLQAAGGMMATSTHACM